MTTSGQIVRQIIDFLEQADITLAEKLGILEIVKALIIDSLMLGEDDEMGS